MSDETVRMVAAWVPVTPQILADQLDWTALMAAARREREFVRVHGPRFGPPLPEYCDECHQLIGPGYRR